MTTLQQIWNFPINEIHQILTDHDIDFSELSDIDSYFLVTDIYLNNFNEEDRKIAMDPLFEETINKIYHDSYPQLFEQGLQNYNFIKNSSKNLTCKYNNFDSNNYPVDPITKKSISNVQNVYTINEKCYDKNTIRKILSEGGINPITNQKLQQNVYNDFNVKSSDIYIKILNLSNKNLNDLKNQYFPPNLEILNLSNNQITNLKNINFPQTLIELNLSNNKIISLLGFNCPKNLKVLDLSNNKITILDFNNPSENLTVILFGNPIQNIEEFKEKFSNVIVEI